jgi:hypothetical protein
MRTRRAQRAEINRRSIFGKGVIRIAIQPTLARLCRRDDGMSAGIGVFRGVAVRRAVAAEGCPTCLACPQMHPVVARLHALFTFTAVRLFDGPDCVEMRTASGGHDSRTGLVCGRVTARCQAHVDSSDGHSAFADSGGATLD